MTVNSRPVLHVLGMGSMGALLAVNLLQTTRTEVIPLFRNTEKLSKFQNEGKSTISIRKVFLKEAPLVSAKLVRSYSPETFNDDHIENLVITTKTYQTKEAIKPYLDFITPETNIILIQNGLGVLEVLKDEVFVEQSKRPNLFQGVIGHGCYQDSAYIFNHAGNAGMKIARLPWDDNMVQHESVLKQDAVDNSLVKILMEKDFASIFNTTHMTYQEMLLGQLQKFLVNSCINPVTAILDCDNGEMVDYCKDIFTSIVEEELNILGLAYRPLFEYEDHYKEQTGYPNLDVKSTLNTESMVSNIINLGCVINAKNSSSMRQDTRYLRDSEIEYINGYIVKLAAKLNLNPNEAKTNRAICQLVNLRLGLNRTRAATGDWPFK
ncbi:hypothetical protein KAFR_0D02670 [Kazachstania africana CBS 2517]|uniref:2-dehydropantoate 2-reductase n=1 Tax=Kazachstania africana (strain ATCC 22294 / BCRC 22015 / CBS 2517 / CECT 1963 / NBRC 1671 / NRRL Y-8276) TaxID=1071382 RepID=H2AU65_KAZAF|nr:hypothetical protein KAFR_0D02670 [Kazachstania africana CBS 2517]CCF57915.1 hypothetical protein KAFR_0D02670 [Kazachstania africana CBS 2517]